MQNLPWVRGLSVEVQCNRHGEVQEIIAKHATVPAPRAENAQVQPDLSGDQIAMGIPIAEQNQTHLALLADIAVAKSGMLRWEADKRKGVERRYGSDCRTGSRPQGAAGDGRE